jgi:hypothetical protein
MTNQGPQWLEAAGEEAWKDAQRIIQDRAKVRELDKYKEDPVGFVEDVLNEFVTDDCKMIMRSVLDNTSTLAKSANGPGKSWSAARIATWFYKVFPDSKVFLTAAPPEENIKKVLWGEVMGIVAKHPDLFAADKVYSRDIERHKESFITRVTIPQSGTSEQRIAKFSGKHAPHILFIVDEGDGVPDEVYQGIEGCMSGGMARMLVMFNPKMQSGALYHMERNGLANVVQLTAFNHPNVITGMDIIPGAVDRDITVRRINEWTEPLRYQEDTDASCFEVPDFLVGTTTKSMSGKEYPPLFSGTRKITNPQFSYMVLGEYPAQSESQLINKAWIDAARSRWDLYVSNNGETPPVGVRPILGLDVAEMGMDYNVACMRYGGFVSRFDMWNGLDTDMTARKTLELYRKSDTYIAMIDGTAVGSSIAPFMSREGRLDSDPVRAISVKVASKPSPIIKTSIGEFYMLRDQLYWATMLWLRDDNTSMLPPDPYLIDELMALQYEVNLRGKIKIVDKERLRKVLKRSPDRADALALTFAPYERPKIMRLME